MINSVEISIIKILYYMAAYFGIKTYCIYTTNLFFREIEVINPDNVPSEGPTIVYGNHNNQFVDGMVLIHLPSYSVLKSKGKSILWLLLLPSEEESSEIC